MGYCFGWGAYNSGLLGGLWWMPLIFWGLLATGIIFIVWSNKGNKTNKALDVLEEEYAMGHISREEYMKRKKDLQK